MALTFDLIYASLKEENTALRVAYTRDTVLIQQPVEALDSVAGAMPFPVARQVLKVARARLEGKP